MHCSNFYPFLLLQFYFGCWYIVIARYYRYLLLLDAPLPEKQVKHPYPAFPKLWEASAVQWIMTQCSRLSRGYCRPGSRQACNILHWPPQVQNTSSDRKSRTQSGSKTEVASGRCSRAQGPGSGIQEFPERLCGQDIDHWVTTTTKNEHLVLHQNCERKYHTF